jgi:ABC-2 type transport system permease protein
MPGGGELYVTFMLPGIVALSALGGSIGGGSVWLDERLRGIVKEYLVAPIRRLSILMGNALSTVTKSLFQAIVIFVVGVLVGAQVNLNPVGWLGGLALVAGYGLGFAGIALSLASKTDNPGAYHTMIMLLNLPLLFLSNALYPLSWLPKWMQIGALINPTSYVIDGVRQMVLENGAALAGGEVLPLWLCFLVVAAFAALGMWLAYSAFKSSVK